MRKQRLEKVSCLPGVMEQSVAEPESESLGYSFSDPHIVE